MLRTAHPEDAASICEIYNYYIERSHATFEEVSLVPGEMRRRIEEPTKTYPWFVWEEDGKMLSYSHGRRWRERAACRRSVELTIYLEPEAVGKGTGSVLFEALLTELRSREFHSVIGGVSLPNPASVRIARKVRIEEGGPLQRGGLEIWQVDRRGVLAADPVRGDGCADSGAGFQFRVTGSCFPTLARWSHHEQKAVGGDPDSARGGAPAVEGAIFRCHCQH